MEIMKLLFVAVAATVLTTFVSQLKPEFSLLVQLSAVAIIVLLISDSLAELFSQIKELTSAAKINNEYILLLIKALVIAISGKVVCDICNDTGNRAIATCVDLGCKICITLLAIPMLKVLLQLAVQLIKQ